MKPPKELPDLDAPRPPLPGFPDDSQPQKQAPEPTKPSPDPEPIIRSAPSQEKPRKDYILPKIETPAKTEKPGINAHEDDMKEFEEAISNINIDMVHNEAEPESSVEKEIEMAEIEKPSDYYKPSELGEGYFSEIEHYMKNKNIHEIMDDVIKKDFLTSMKDYHDNKEQGKQFYLHKHDLTNKLKKKMKQLRRLEEGWHGMKEEIAKREKKRMESELIIDQESQELKDLFKQIKVNHWFEQQAPKEHYFKLRNGQELKTLNDLRKALGYMTDEEFNSHVNEEKNDFANWVKDILQNPELYEKIKDVKTKEELEEVLKNPI